MNKNLLSFIIILAVFFSTNYLRAQEKIAFVDINYIYSNSKIGKKFTKELESKLKSINKEIQDLQKKLDDEKKNVISQKNILAENEYKKKIVELESNLKKYNEIISKKNKDLTDFKSKSKNEFTKTLRSTLEKYAKENSISMILRKDQILIGKNNLDITKDILDLFNKS